MVVTKTSLEHPGRSELDDLVQEFQSLAMHGSSPLGYLSSVVVGYEQLKGKEGRHRPSVLETHIASFLNELSDVIARPASDIPDKYKILIKIFEEKCYQPARLGENDLKQWPYVRGDKLVDAFIVSAGFLDFLDRCLDRSGMIDSILFHLLSLNLIAELSHLFLIQPLTSKGNRKPYLR